MLRPHHIAWLSYHKHRTKAWLTRRLKDGFDVHHVDGNHENNDPPNLVLIEHTDHIRLHGMTGLGRLARRASKIKKTVKKPIVNPGNPEYCGPKMKKLKERLELGKLHVAIHR